MIGQIVLHILALVEPHRTRPIFDPITRYTICSYNHILYYEFLITNNWYSIIIIYEYLFQGAQQRHLMPAWISTHQTEICRIIIKDYY